MVDIRVIVEEELRRQMAIAGAMLEEGDALDAQDQDELRERAAIIGALEGILRKARRQQCADCPSRRGR